MKSVFAQTAEHRIDSTTRLTCLNDLPAVIRKHTVWDYSCTQTDTGCFLKPTFRNMPYRNSFVPEINVVVSPNDTQTILYMRGQPVRFVRIFIVFWFSFLLIMEIFLLANSITSNSGSLLPVFIPIIVCAFGYFLCKIATKAAFKSVMKAIQKELK